MSTIAGKHQQKPFLELYHSHTNFRFIVSTFVTITVAKVVAVAEKIALQAIKRWSHLLTCENGHFGDCIESEIWRVHSLYTYL